MPTTKDKFLIRYGSLAHARAMVDTFVLNKHDNESMFLSLEAADRIEKDAPHEYPAVRDKIMNTVNSPREYDNWYQKSLAENHFKRPKS